MHKVLVIVGDGAEVIDTLVPFYRLSEDYQVDIAAPAVRTYHMVQHHHRSDWDITVETTGYNIESKIANTENKQNEYKR